jgi:hypothetical protein
MPKIKELRAWGMGEKCLKLQMPKMPKIKELRAES